MFHSKIKIHKKLPLLIYAGCGTSLLLVILVGATSLYFSERQKQKEYSVEHTYQVLEKVHTVHRHLYEMGMDKQRYRSTGLNIFFQSYRLYSDSLLTELNALNKMVPDNPLQVERIKYLGRQIDGLLKFWQDEDVNLKNSDTRSFLGITWAEKAKMDTISLGIAAIGAIELRLLMQREEGSSWLRERTEFAIIGGTLLILILVCFLIYFILQELKNRINAYQNEKEINRLKSNFVSLASHEFRTPLSSILLSVSLMEKYIQSQDTKNVFKHSQRIKTSVNNLRGILEDFLSLDKLNAGKIQAVFQPFDLVELCEDVIDELSYIARPAQTLHFEYTGIQKIVNLDNNLIRNAIINLVTNAVKYAGDNAVIILKAEITANEVIISIKDNGVGIAAHEQAQLFTPFFRISNTGNIPGTGLGLSIVLRYVNLMKGNISFSSVPYQETCFAMSFPLTALSDQCACEDSSSFSIISSMPRKQHLQK
ncbi:MAG TPA: ATP-binding protein [Mucilaginibacter sp.]|jgi:signal transduction histidine kinase